MSADEHRLPWHDEPAEPLPSTHDADDDSGAVSLPRVLDPRDPLAIARRYIAEHKTDESGSRRLHAWKGDIRVWTGTHYPVVEEAAVRAEIYEYLEAARRPVKGNASEPFRPTAAAVNNVLDALRAAAHLKADRMPAWLDGREQSARGLLACTNGILDLSRRTLLPHSPDFYVAHELPYECELSGPPPTEWLRFLSTLWPSDTESIAALQEMFGYTISGETRQQKMFLLVGPKRSGKGTIARVLRALMGEANVAGPTLSALTGNFGMQSLIDRPLAIISDARLSGRADQAVIVERLLSISGEDVLDVDRKYREPWTGQLPTRIVILTNELPRLADTSGALASRFLVLTFNHSWYGREDIGLSERLVRELTGILRWSLDGLDRLNERGCFVTPAASAAAVNEMEDLGSPVGAFVRDACIVEPGAEIPTADLYGAWARWCRDRGQEHVTTEQVFSRDLRAVMPGLTTAQRRNGADRWRVFVGVRRAGGL